MIVLAFDTSAGHCAAALRNGAATITRVEEMTRGQAERLMPLLEEVLAEAGIAWRDLDALGVCTGPGNFTGIRISVAAARGLALSLGIPAVGVSALEAAGHGAPLPHFATAPGPRGMVYAQDVTATGRAAPALLDPDELPRDIPILPRPDAAILAARVAEIAADRVAGGHDLPRPAPLYVKPADAAPASDAPPRILP